MGDPELSFRLHRVLFCVEHKSTLHYVALCRYYSVLQTPFFGPLRRTSTPVAVTPPSTPRGERRRASCLSIGINRPPNGGRGEQARRPRTKPWPTSLQAINNGGSHAARGQQWRAAHQGQAGKQPAPFRAGRGRPVAPRTRLVPHARLPGFAPSRGAIRGGSLAGP